MTKKRKSHTGEHQATLKTSKYIYNPTVIGVRIKAVIIALALWGIFPVKVAEWIKQLGGSGDES